jgi:hypothetical protein
MKNWRESVQHETVVKPFKKSSAFGGTEGSTLLEGSESSDSNISNECDSRDEDFLWFV